MKSSTYFLYLGTCLLLSLFSPFNASPTRQKGTLREARLILPQNDNDGQPLLPVREELESKLLISFGGFTHLDGIGRWDSESANGTLEVHHEPVWIYDVGCLDTPQSVMELTEIALWLKTVANQDSVYLRLPNGDIVFV